METTTVGKLLVLVVRDNGTDNPDTEPVFCINKPEDFYYLRDNGMLDDIFPFDSYACIATIH